MQNIQYWNSVVFVNLPRSLRPPLDLSYHRIAAQLVAITWPLSVSLPETLAKSIQFRHGSCLISSQATFSLHHPSSIDWSLIFFPLLLLIIFLPPIRSQSFCFAAFYSWIVHLLYKNWNFYSQEDLPKDQVVCKCFKYELEEPMRSNGYNVCACCESVCLSVHGKSFRAHKARRLKLNQFNWSIFDNICSSVCVVRAYKPRFPKCKMSNVSACARGTRMRWYFEKKQKIKKRNRKEKSIESCAIHWKIICCQNVGRTNRLLCRNGRKQIICAHSETDRDHSFVSLVAVTVVSYDRYFFHFETRQPSASHLSAYLFVCLPALLDLFFFASILHSRCARTNSCTILFRFFFSTFHYKHNIIFQLLSNVIKYSAN